MHASRKGGRGGGGSGFLYIGQRVPQREGGDYKYATDEEKREIRLDAESGETGREGSRAGDRPARH
jgi:hypothetical protein